MSNKNRIYNEGQYGLKPWAANLIMGILELALLVGWVLCVFPAFFNSNSIEEAEIGLNILLIVLYLVWNILVWTIKPLRTKWNWKEAKWNVVVIISLIIDIIFVLKSASEMSGGFEGF